MSRIVLDVLPLYFSSNIKIRQPETRTHYERSFRQFGECLGRPATLDDLCDDLVTKFILWSVGQGVAEVTANQRAKQIRAFWEWAARRRLVEVFPTFRKIEEPEQMPIAYMPGELPLLFGACKKQTGYIGPIPADLWWLSQHWWFFATGERTEATLLLRREHVDLVNGIARVPASIRKGGRKNMVYKMPPRLCELLAEVVRYPSQGGLVWERHFGLGAYHGRYRKLIASSGLPVVRGKSGPKKMRITVLTMVRALGGDATDFAKHSSKQVTDDSYIDDALILAIQKGVWPPVDINPEGSKAGWLKRFFGKAG